MDLRLSNTNFITISYHYSFLFLFFGIKTHQSQSVHQNYSKGSTSSVVHSQTNSGFNIEASTSHNLGAKNQQFNHIGNMGINLCRRFDSTSSNTTPSSSNTFHLTTSHENPFFDDNSRDDYIYNDFEGMN